MQLLRIFNFNVFGCIIPVSMVIMMTSGESNDLISIVTCIYMQHLNAIGMNQYNYRLKPHGKGKIFRDTQTCLIWLWTLFSERVFIEGWKETPLWGL